jgi:uncharacterized protein
MRARGLRSLRHRGFQPRGVLLLVLALAAACQDHRPAVDLKPKSGPAVRVFVEVAETPDLQTRGLMYRTHLEPDRGMIFLFDGEKVHSFWMKNTVIPLDMLFISRDGRIVGIAENTEPFSLKPVGPAVPCQAVLEVNGGFAATHGLAVGDTVAYRNISSAKLP